MHFTAPTGKTFPLTAQFAVATSLELYFHDQSEKKKKQLGEASRFASGV